MRWKVLRVAAVLLFPGLISGCQRAQARRCAEYDRAQAFFDRLSAELLDPNLGHPRFAEAATLFDAVGEDCLRKERARYLAASIRKGLAARRDEEARLEREREKADQPPRRRRSFRRERRSNWKAPAPTGVYCEYSLSGHGPLMSGLCYERNSVSQAERACRDHIQRSGETGRCTCKYDKTLWERYCR